MAVHLPTDARDAFLIAVAWFSVTMAGSAEQNRKRAVDSGKFAGSSVRWLKGNRPGWLLLSTTNDTNWTNDEGNRGRMVIHSFVRFVLFVVETRNIRSAGSDSR